MKKNLRDGVNLEVAFKSIEIQRSINNFKENFASTAMNQDKSVVVKNNTIGINTFIKNILKKIFNSFMKLIKPILKPILIRFRDFFLENLHKEIYSFRDQILARVFILNNEVIKQKQYVETITENNDKIRFTLNLLQKNQNDINSQITEIKDYTFAAARRVAINCGSGEILIKTEFGYILCDEDDISTIAGLIDTGDIELGTRRIIEKIIGPGKVFVDVGANIGVHTLAAARRMQGNGKIYAFEPFPRTKALLEKSIWLNGFSEIVEVHQKAITNQEKNLKLYLGKTSGHHSLYHEASDSLSSQKYINVESTRLDKAILTEKQIDLIKIDVEGAELQVLESSKEFILTNPHIAIIAEFSIHHLKKSGITTGDWLQHFFDLGFLYRAINSLDGSLENWTVDQLNNCYSVNLLFAKKHSTIWDI
jgi:FkbM family methyltransferase